MERYKGVILFIILFVNDRLLFSINEHYDLRGFEMAKLTYGTGVHYFTLFVT